MNGVVSQENLLASVLSWINYDKKSRRKALDYTSGYLELKDCRKQFLTDSVKVHIDIFQSNPEFNRRVTHLLHPRKLTVVVIGGTIEIGKGVYSSSKVWKLVSETNFVEITEISDEFLRRIPSICYFYYNKLILTGGYEIDVCVVLDMSTKEWKKMKYLKNPRYRHASVSILQQVFVFGGDMAMSKPLDWSTSVEYLNIEQEHGEWQSAPPMPSALHYPKITNLDTNIYLMGDNNPVLYLFDVSMKVWYQKTAMPQNPRLGFSITSSNSNLYAAGGQMRACWQYICSTDSWIKLSSPALRHGGGAMIFHQNSLLLLGGQYDHIEGYSTEADIWVEAPYKLPKRLYHHYVFMMDLGE